MPKHPPKERKRIRVDGWLNPRPRTGKVDEQRHEDFLDAFLEFVVGRGFGFTGVTKVVDPSELDPANAEIERLETEVNALRESAEAWKRVATHPGECEHCRTRLLGPPEAHEHCMQLDALYTAAVEVDFAPTPQPATDAAKCPECRGLKWVLDEPVAPPWKPCPNPIHQRKEGDTDA